MGIRAIPLLTNKFNPIGGVRVAISTFATIMTAKWIGLIPMAVATGNNKGAISTIIDTQSKIMPSNNKTIFKTSRNSIAVIFIEVIASTKVVDTHMRASTKTIKLPAILMANIIAVYRIESRADDYISPNLTV